MPQQPDSQTRIEQIRGYANNLEHLFNLTGALTHEHVKSVAQWWVPELRFHEDERLHSLSLNDYVRRSYQMTSTTETWSPALPLLICERKSPYLTGDYMVGRRKNESTQLVEDVALPIGENQRPKLCGFFTKDGQSHQSFGDNCISQTSFFTNLEDYSLETVYDDSFGKRELKKASTLLSNYEMSLAKFGSTHTEIKQSKTVQLPKFKPIGVTCECRMLLECLRENLLAHQDALYPVDAADDPIRGDLFASNFAERTSGEDRGKLLQLIDAHLHNDQQAVDATLSELSSVISDREWTILRDHCFLEFYLVYQHSDWAAYESLGNQHEGDVEGFCLVFLREELEEAAATIEPIDALRNVKPSYLITAAHMEWQGLDWIEELSNPAPSDITVWIARGSHACYQRAGSIKTHIGLSGLFKNPWLSFTLVVGAPLLLAALAILAWLIGHLFGPHDETSNSGVSTRGPETTSNNQDPPDGTAVELEVDVTPLSFDNNLYATGGRSLNLRSFHGRFGRSTSASPRFSMKTSRYFRKLDWFVKMREAGPVLGNE